MNLFRYLQYQLDLHANRKRMEHEAREAEAGVAGRPPRSWIFRSVMSVFVMLGLAAGIFYAMNFSSYFGVKDLNRTQTPIAEVLGFDLLIQNGSVADLIKYASEHQTDDSNSLPEQLAELKKRIAIADRVIEIESQKSGSSVLSAPQTIKMGAIMQLDRLHQQHKLKNDYVELQLNEYVIPMLSNSNQEIAAEAHVCMCFSRCQKYLYSPTAENFAQMRQQFMASVAFSKESLSVAQKLVKISKLVDPAASSEAQQFLIDLAESLGHSSQPAIQLLGAELRDYALVAGENLQTLAMGIGLNDRAAIDRGIQFVEKVADENRFGETAYSWAISLVELMDRMGYRESLKPAVAKLVESVASVPQVESRQNIQEIVNDFVQRQELTGKPFRLEATTAAQVDLSKCIGNVVVIIFFDLSFQSGQAFETVGQLEYFANSGVTFVAIELENSLNSNDQEKSDMAREELRNRFTRFIFLESHQAAGLFEQCPVRTGPFLILLDRDHEVRATNINPDYLRKLLENLTQLP